MDKLTHNCITRFGRYNIFIVFISIKTFKTFKLNLFNKNLLLFNILPALNTTGGYFNPILASALTLGCEGNTFIEHFFVYWFGAIIGGLGARYMHILLRGIPKEKIA